MQKDRELCLPGLAKGMKKHDAKTSMQDLKEDALCIRYSKTGCGYNAAYRRPFSAYHIKRVERKAGSSYKRKSLFYNTMLIAGGIGSVLTSSASALFTPIETPYPLVVSIAAVS